MKQVDEQMVQFYHKHGNSTRKIADAMDLSQSAVSRCIRREEKEPMNQTVMGEGCYTTCTDTGYQLPTEGDNGMELDWDEGLTITDRYGDGEKIDSGYPDIYFNERTGQFEVWLNYKRIWRDTKLTKACEVRLSKGNLSPSDTKLLTAIVNSSDELREALDVRPI